MKEMLFRFEFFVDLPVDLDVLEGAMEDYQDFCIDGPVVEVGDVAFESELQGT